ncbi:MAG: preprotein translocase subunit YajC [Pseudomonadota bacterium]|nr:preprotein translocase subunit YajC [Pseudomonadota bacterium]
MWISSAVAQVAEGAVATPTSSATGMIFQLVFIAFVFYFLFIRPQQKRIKKHEAELNAIIKGTQIIVGGLLGKVVSILDDEKLLVEFADGVQITVLRAYVSQVLFETPLKQQRK